MSIGVTPVTCYRCHNTVPVQRPPGNVDFTFPCPHCGTRNQVEDAPKEISVKVPPGYAPGSSVRFLTPEGIKMEAAVPADHEPGSSFIALYRVREAAANAALLHLSEHVVDEKDLELAPEDCKECCICLEEYKVGDKQAFLPCFHRFHAACAKSSLKESRRCPMCNHDFHAAAFEARKLLCEDSESSNQQPASSRAPSTRPRADDRSDTSCRACAVS